MQYWIKCTQKAKRTKQDEKENQGAEEEEEKEEEVGERRQSEKDESSRNSKTSGITNINKKIQSQSEDLQRLRQPIKASQRLSGKNWE